MLARFAALAYDGIHSTPQHTATVRPQSGLKIVLSIQEDAITLQAVQEERPLDPHDAQVIAAAFVVPPDAEPSCTVRQTRQRVSGRPIHEHSVTWRWREVPC